MQNRIKGKAKGGFLLAPWRVAVILIVTMGVRGRIRVMVVC